MIAAIPSYGTRLIQLLQQQGIRDERVLQAMMTTPRPLFVDEALRARAWENIALPIGAGQTLSQPYMVARMSELLLQELSTAGPILEIGTGSGYQTAILAQLLPQVCTMERIKSLQLRARRQLKQLDLYNVAFKYGDGCLGWPGRAPFAGIIVTAAAAEVPAPLLAQLSDGGCLIIPLGAEQQQLCLIRRYGDNFERQYIENVRFVPLIAGETQ